MDPFNQPLDVVEYVDAFFKQIDPSLISGPEGGISDLDVVMPTAQGDSPQGPPTDVETGDTTAPSGVVVDTQGTYAAFDLNTNTPITAPPPEAPPARAKRASAVRAGALWNAESIAAANRADAEEYLATIVENSKKNEAYREKKNSQANLEPLPAMQPHNNKAFAAAAAVKKTRKKRRTKSMKDEELFKAAEDRDFICRNVDASARAQARAQTAPEATQLLPQRESKRERQKPAALRDPNMLDPDAALLMNPEYADKPMYAAVDQVAIPEMVSVVWEQEGEILQQNAGIDISSSLEAPVEEAVAHVPLEAIEAAPRVVFVEEMPLLLPSAAETPEKAAIAVVEQELKVPRSAERLRSKHTTAQPVQPAVERLPKPSPAVKKTKRTPTLSPNPAAVKKQHQSRTPTPPALNNPPPPQPEPTALRYQQPSVPPHTLTQDDVLLGCNKCRFTKTGCSACRGGTPAFTRPPNRWNPFQGHHQVDIPAIPSFRPTHEEFKDPVAYITKIMPEATKYGLAHIIPPDGWDPPFALEKGTNGVSMESFKFSIRKQLTSHLCYRSAPLKKNKNGDGGGAEGAAAGVAAGGGGGDSRYGKKKKSGNNNTANEVKPTVEPATVVAGAGVNEEIPSAAATVEEENKEQEKPSPPPPPAAAAVLTADDILAALAAANSGEQLLQDLGTLSLPLSQQEEESEDSEDSEIFEEEEEEHGNQIKISGEIEPVPTTTDFGFVSLEKKQTLRSFAAYADWVKAVHFSDPPALGQGISTAPKRRPLKVLPIKYSAPVEPSVEEIEAEFWRIVETPDTYLESLYGQDLDSGHHGSGFPLPEWRRRLLETHLTVSRNNKISSSSDNNNEEEGGQHTTNLGNLHQNQTTTGITNDTTTNSNSNVDDKIPPPVAVELPAPSTEAEILYSEHPWNINNMPRSKSSMLRYLLGDGLITGVMVPWLYVGSCLSAFCWHVEDHALYSVNYLHMGAPKVWYGVPADATLALEEAMKDALPHLFESNPGLLHQLVTTLSPMELKKRGVPVHRVVHEAGSFIVTMPDAYHSGFNTGFNCAEAVNFAAPGWIPFGTDISQKYRDAVRPVTMSHDSLLVALATAAQHVEPTKEGKQKQILVENTDTTDIIITDSDAGVAEENLEAAATTTAAPATAPAAKNINIKQANGFGPLGDIPWADAPLDGIILGTGELALRAAEEKERWAAGAQALVQLGGVSNGCVDDKQNVKEGEEDKRSSPAAVIDPSTTTSALPTSTPPVPLLLENVLPCRTMDPCTSNPGSKDPVTGMYEDTAECDCHECQGDLWLAAVVSSAAPGVAVCPEHAATLVNKHKCPFESLVLLCRYSPSDLQQLVDVAVDRIEGAEEAVVAAHARREKLEAERVRAKTCGSLYPTNEFGECIGASVGAAGGAGIVEGGAIPPVVPAEGWTLTGKRKKVKPKKRKRRTYFFKKKEGTSAPPVENPESGSLLLPPPPSAPAPTAPEFTAFDDGIANVIVEELRYPPAALPSGGIRNVEPSSDVEMLMVSQREQQYSEQQEQHQGAPQISEPPPQQPREPSETAVIDTGLDDVETFAAALDVEFTRRSNEASLAISDLQNENSLQPSTAAGEGAALAMLGSAVPSDAGLVSSNIFTSGRGTTSSSELMLMDVVAEPEQAAVEAEQVKEDDAAAAAAVEVEAPEAPKAEQEGPIPHVIQQNQAMFNLNSDN